MNHLVFLSRFGCILLVMIFVSQSVWSQNDPLKNKIKKLGKTKKFFLHGTIRTGRAVPLPNLSIEAFDKKAGRRPHYLGKSKTDIRGYYSINYTTKVTKSMMELGRDLLIRVYDSKRTLLAESSLLVNAPANSRINLVIPEF
jgi:hypothetical protein